MATQKTVGRIWYSGIVQAIATTMNATVAIRGNALVTMIRNGTGCSAVAIAIRTIRRTSV